MDWISIFIYDTTWAFAAEIVIRTTIMFCLIILLLRSTGKRGIPPYGRIVVTPK